MFADRLADPTPFTTDVTTDNHTVVVHRASQVRRRGGSSVRRNELVRSAQVDDSAKKVDLAETSAKKAADHRLRKHADYQRVYREGRKQFSASMSYFFALRGEAAAVGPGPRVGLTAGKVLGNAVERNRIKRRMRDIVRRRVGLVNAAVDIVLHPKKSVLTADFAKLESEVARIFTTIQSGIDKQAAAKRAESKVEA